GVRRMARLLSSPRLRLIAVTLVLLSPLFGEAAARLGPLVLTIALTVGVTVTWFVGDYFVLRPLRSLHAATERMAVGDLTARVPTQPSVTELAKLGQRFNHMAQALETRAVALAQQQTSIQTRETHLARIIDTVPDALLISDQDGRYLQV